MILSKKIEINISNNQIKYWLNKGYNVKGNDKKIKVNVSDLPNNSGQKIKVKCDICGTIKEITKNRYMNNTKNETTYYSCSRKCSNNKYKDTCLEKYKVDNISKLKEIKKKKENTTLLNYNVSFPMQNNIIKDKSSESKLFKYNDKNYNNQTKRRKTSLIKYGVDIPTKYEKIKEKLSKNNRINYNEMLETIKKTDYKYLDNDENYINSHSKIKITCPEHGNFYQKLYKHKQGQGCPKCNQSKGEKIIENFLKKHNIKFETQKKFENCKNKKQLPFDFYLPDFNVCIEYDGLQHFESVEFFGGNEYLEKIIENDNIKNSYCKNNNIDLLRIPYNYDVEDILNNIFLK